MILVRTPYRISFFGGGTDYPVWYRKNGGAVLSTTIDKFCYLSVRILPPFFEHKYRVVYSRIESLKDISEIEHPSVRECLRFIDMEEGIEIHHDGDLPARSGIGSSSAFTVGLLYALHALKNTIPSKLDLAKEAIYVEQERIKETVGSQDQVACTFGGLNKIIFTNSAIKVEPIKMEGWGSFESSLMLVYTGQVRNAEVIASNYSFDIDRLTTMRGMVDEAINLLIKGDILNFGRLLDRTWRLKKGLAETVSNPTVDAIYQSALKAGAIGGKLCGAGGGGFLLLLVDPEARERVAKVMDRLLIVPFRFEGRGVQLIVNQ